MSVVVRAAGGVVWRTGASDAIEVLLVHRPRYDDWSLPKGKAERGETDEACALREVEEETGLACELGQELAVVGYVDAQGRPKQVRYFEMRPLRGRFHPHAEVDEIAWLDPERAIAALSYGHDRELLADAIGRLRAGSIVPAP